MSTTDLAPTTPHTHTPPTVVDPRARLEEMREWCKLLADSTMVPAQYRGNPANILFAAEYADMLGVSRVHMLTSINVIEGKPTASADLMASMVRRAGHRLRVEGDDTKATATLTRSDDPDYEFSCTWDEAKARRAGLIRDNPTPKQLMGPWYRYRAALLRARAISEVVRMGASEVMHGVIYTEEEMRSSRVYHATATREPASPTGREVTGGEDTTEGPRGEQPDTATGSGALHAALTSRKHSGAGHGVGLDAEEYATIMEAITTTASRDGLRSIMDTAGQDTRLSDEQREAVRDAANQRWAELGQNPAEGEGQPADRDPAENPDADDAVSFDDTDNA